MRPFLLIFIAGICLQGQAQVRDGRLEGKVIDASSLRPLFGVKVVETISGSSIVSKPDGSFSLKLSPGIKSITFLCDSFQRKIVRHINIDEDGVTVLNGYLLPINFKDKLDSLADVSFDEEMKTGYKLNVLFASSNQPAYSSNTVLDKDAEGLLRRTLGISFRSQNLLQPALGFVAEGMGSRYNNLVIDGAAYSNNNQFGKVFLVNVLPLEMFESAKVFNQPNVINIQGFSGSAIEIKTKDLPDENFLYAKGGFNYYDKTIGKDFFSDKGNTTQFLSFPGSLRNLPAEFLTTRSRYSLDQKNIQEQIHLSQQLKNNLGVFNHKSTPNTSFSIGGAKLYKFKNGNKAGFSAFINNEKQQQINEVSVQAMPDIVSNPFPFDQNLRLVKSLSQNNSYSYYSFLNAGINAAYYLGRNKVSFKVLAINSFSNTYTRRSAVEKIDEDSLAHSGVNFITEQRRLYMLNLSGEHALGQKSMLHLTWHAAYSFLKQDNPDERNFLLRQNQQNADQYEIANQAGVGNDITNTYRMWRTLKENNFNGSFALSIPFKTGKVTNLLSGGASIETKHREFFSDIYIVMGTGYSSIESLLSSEKYYPGGLSVVNYYSNQPGYQNLNDRGNYIGSVNLSSSFLKLENQITKKLRSIFSIRAESNNQLVSSTQYNYFTGFRYPQAVTIDQNVTVSKLNLLPAVSLKYSPVGNLIFHAGFFKSVNRAQLEELSVNRYFDAAAFMVKTGNQYLRNSSINNFQAGADLTIGSSLISLSGFYKTIDQPIEYIISPYTSSTLLSMPFNLPEATLKGINVAFDINVGNALNATWRNAINLFGKATFLVSKVKAGPIKNVQIPFVEEHALSGSPSFSANGGFSVHLKKYPSITVSYSRIGDYISQVGSGANQKLDNGNHVLSTPYYRVKANNFIDIHLSQSIFHSSFLVAAGIKNLLGEDFIEYQDLNGNKKFDDALLLAEKNGRGGYYQSGTDNAVMQMKPQRNIYFSISYLFRKP